LKIDIMTLFPDMIEAVLGESIIGRARKKGAVEIRCHQIRDYTTNRQRQVDDYPYGGGQGAVLQAQPLHDCWKRLCEEAGGPVHTIYLSPAGKVFTQQDARRLRDNYEHLILVCGHYEGVDERFVEACADEEISMGDYVLTGGEIPAMALADAVCRLVPGVLSEETCFTDESHWDGLLEYPQYSRPEVWNGRRVPEVLLSGNHAEVARWRRRQQLVRTAARRPDLFENRTLSEADAAIWAEAEADLARPPLPEELHCRPMTEADLPEVLEISREAQAFLHEQGADQWQDAYPNEAAFLADMDRGEAYVLACGGRVLAFFSLSGRPEKAYDAITDGKWSDDLPYCVLHRAAVAAAYRGTGLADRLVAEAEALTRSMGRKRLRVDTHKKNKPMQRLLARHGFRYRGNVAVVVGEGHDTRRLAYEKRLKAAPEGAGSEEKNV